MNFFQELKDNLFLIAGPCVIENEDILVKTAETIQDISKKLDMPFIFKTSYDKANRTSIGSYRGPGLIKGLKILSNLKNKLGIKILTDVHTPADIEKVAEAVDIIQIPAFLCRQTDMLLSAGKTGKPVNVKKGQFLSPHSVRFIIEKLEHAGCHSILITERGTSFGHGHLVVDFSGIPVMKKFGYPVVYDATHSVQKPSTGESQTGGNRNVITDLLYAAVSAGVGGIFMEVHPQPEKALSDRDSQFPLDQLEKVMHKAKQIYQLIHG